MRTGLLGYCWAVAGSAQTSAPKTVKTEYVVLKTSSSNFLVIGMRRHKGRVMTA